MSIEKVGLALGLAIGAIGIAVSAIMVQKTNRIAQKVDMTTTDLAERMPVDIQDAIVDKAVRMAVDREVGRAITMASNDAVRKVASDLEMQVRRAVMASYDSVTASVSGEIARQVEKIDIEKLKSEVTEKAKDAILEKFDDNLDEVLKEFKHNLENIPKVYGAILGSMTKKPDNGFVIKLP